MPRPDERIELTFGGITAAYTPVELEELGSFRESCRSPEEAEWYARFVHEWKSIDPGAELLPTGPRLASGRYG